MGENENFIGVARTPVNISEKIQLKGFIIGDLAGIGPGNQERLRNPYVQVSYKKIMTGMVEGIHKHGPANCEFVFVLSNDWGPIVINGQSKGLVSPGEFTLVRGERTYLEWHQEKRASKVLVVKEPSLNDKRPLTQEDLWEMPVADFLKSDFVEVSRKNNGLIASPDNEDERLRTSKMRIFYFQKGFPFQPVEFRKSTKVLVLVVGGEVDMEVDGNKIHLATGGMTLVDSGKILDKIEPNENGKIFVIEFPKTENENTTSH